MKYSDNIDYLIASVGYLGVHSYYWARSPIAMAKELGLDENRLEQVFNGFPGIFRKSARLAANGQHYYALQVRYAQREGSDTDDPDELSGIEPVSNDKLRTLNDFILKMSEQERSARISVVSNSVSVTAAIISAATAVAVALIKHSN